MRGEFLNALRRLGRSPGIGHYHDELLDRRYRFWNFSSYVVACAWRPRPIRIIAIAHAARDLGVFFSLRTGSES